MGFRGINDFNMSLLGKHYLRLSIGGDSLLGRVFKSKYYPRTSIKEAEIGFVPIYTWRSILESRNIVEYGSGWRIGNGRNVRV